jgi:hypothetical protein
MQASCGPCAMRGTPASCAARHQQQPHAVRGPADLHRYRPFSSSKCRLFKDDTFATGRRSLQSALQAPRTWQPRAAGGNLIVCAGGEKMTVAITGACCVVQSVHVAPCSLDQSIDCLPHLVPQPGSHVMYVTQGYHVFQRVSEILKDLRTY